MFEVETTLTLDGVEYAARVEFHVTEWGAAPIIDYVNGGDPGWGPEWEVSSIWLTPIDEDGDKGREFQATGALFNRIFLHERIDDAIYARVREMEWEGI